VPAAAVELHGLSKSFGSVPAVRGIDLIVSRGEIVAILGPNGAGKSTTAELILGITRPDDGRVAIFGQAPRAAVTAGRVGAMLQAGALLQEATVQDVLRLMHGLHQHPLPLPEIISRADLGSFLRTRTDKLSGGQAQRLRYGLAIMPDPELLVLDEPTVGMDVEIRRSFWASMRDFIDSGRTVLFATHYLDEADAVADRVVMLAEGRLVADGTGAEIKSGVTGRTVSMAADSVDASVVAALPQVLNADVSGSRLLLHTHDSDSLLRVLLDSQPAIRDIEVASARLEDAFLALTASTSEER
jgi:ABC-2 type transport system ATP-binding protein